MTKVYLYEPKSGQTIKLNAEAGKFNYTEEDKQRAEPNNFTATLTFKLGKRMREKIRWALYGCKTRKEYRKFKKQRKRLTKDCEIIYRIKKIDNPKVVKCLNRLKKLLKNTKIQTINV